jgi:hypothetical protein
MWIVGGQNTVKRRIFEAREENREIEKLHIEKLQSSSLEQRMR